MSKPVLTSLGLADAKNIVLTGMTEFVRADTVCWVLGNQLGSKVLVAKPPTLTDRIHGQKHNFVYLHTSDSPNQILHEKLSAAQVKTVRADGKYFTRMGVDQVRKDYFTCPGWHETKIAVRYSRRFQRFMDATASPTPA